MKKDYSQMTADEQQKEFAKLNRKLIIPNVVIAIIAAIACFTQLFMPFFKMSVTLNSEVVSVVVDTVCADYDDDESLVESNNSVLNALVTKTNIKEMTATLNTALSVEFTATGLISLAFASDDTVEDEVITLLADMIDKMDIKDELETALNEMMPSVISTAVTTVVTEQIVASLSEGEELTEEQTTAIETASTEITASVQKLAESTPETIEEVKTAVREEVNASVSTAMTELGYSEEDIASVSDEIDAYFDEFVDAAINEEGNFSYITVISNLDALIEALNNYSSSDSSAESATSETNAIRYSLIADITEGNETTDDSTSISYYISLLDDSESLVREFIGESLDHDTLQMIKIAAMGLFIFVAVIAALWGILAILALLHIVLHNKKVGMWYVKLFGGLAAIIFFLVPAVFISFSRSIASTLATTFSIEESIITTILGSVSFGGSGIIILICLLVLWLVSIFWCHPIKRHIKACRRALNQ